MKLDMDEMLMLAGGLQLVYFALSARHRGVVFVKPARWSCTKHLLRNIGTLSVGRTNGASKGGKCWMACLLADRVLKAEKDEIVDLPAHVGSLSLWEAATFALFVVTDTIHLVCSLHNIERCSFILNQRCHSERWKRMTIFRCPFSKSFQFSCSTPRQQDTIIVGRPLRNLIKTTFAGRQFCLSRQSQG